MSTETIILLGVGQLVPVWAIILFMAHRIDSLREDVRRLRDDR